MTRDESAASRAEDADIASPTDEELILYSDTYITHYRGIIERYFSQMAEYLSFYAQYPFKTAIIRSDSHGVLIFRKHDDEAQTEIMQWSDLPAGLLTLFDIRDHFDAPFGYFNFTRRTYRVGDAEVEATRAALTDALAFFWHFIDPDQFRQLCKDLIQAEGFTVENLSDDLALDAVGTVVFAETAGFRREERWAFRFHARDNRVSSSDIREAEVFAREAEFDTVCLITPGDLTSIGNYVSVESTAVRIWDRSVLNHLVNRHLTIIDSYFINYTDALTQLDAEFRQRGGQAYERAKARLADCPAGKAYYAQFEAIGTDFLSELFPDGLGPPRSQSTTRDGVHRRDVAFRIIPNSPFFRRIATRFGADFLIVDFKNYARPVDGPTLESIAKYANRALGRIVLAVTRKGASSASRAAQIRIFNEREVVVLPISDEHVLEMVARKERGEQPEDVLEDLLDEFLLAV
jgi:hypothetical protein